MRALLIDPYQREIHRIHVDYSLVAWHRILGCESAERLEFDRNWNGTRAIEILVDSEGILKDAIPPTFNVAWPNGNKYKNPLAGYGLVVGTNLTTGEPTDCLFCDERMKPFVRWERWEKRLNPDDYFEQLFAIHSWETFGPSKAPKSLGPSKPR